MDDLSNDSFGVHCPVCGSKNYKRSYRTEMIAASFGPLVQYMHANCTCFACKADGDFYQENDAKIEEAVAQSRQAAVGKMIDNLSLRGHKPSHIERVLGLRQGSLKRWRERCTPEGAALLMVLMAKPEALEVLDNPVLWSGVI